MSKQAILEDIVRVQEIIGEKNLTREDYRKHGNHTEYSVIQNFGTIKAAKRAAGVESSRGANQLSNQLARHVESDAYDKMNIEKRDYIDKYRKPTGRRFQTMLVASDVHDELCDPFWRRVFIDTVDRLKPDTVVLGGDIFDLAEFGRYKVDPREWDIVAKIKWVHQFLADIRESSPDSELVFIEGNHEHRLLRYLTENAPTLQTLLSDLHGWTVPQLLGLDDYEVRYVARADLATFTKSNVVKEVSKNYEVFHDCLLVDHFPSGKNKGLPGFNGHHHQHLCYSLYNHVQGSYEWHQLGCGHRRSAEYCAGEKWNMGFATAVVDTANSKPVIDYHFVGDFALIHGKHYYRSTQEV